MPLFTCLARMSLVDRSLKLYMPPPFFMGTDKFTLDASDILPLKSPMDFRDVRDMSLMRMNLQDDESLLIQSGKPVGKVRTHDQAPRVLIANSNLVPEWASWEHFEKLKGDGLMMYGQMTAGSWIYIGTTFPS